MEAGGGVIHSSTDELGYNAVDFPHCCSYLHATVLHQPSLNLNKIEIHPQGLTMHLIEDGSPIPPITT